MELHLAYRKALGHFDRGTRDNDRTVLSGLWREWGASGVPKAAILAARQCSNPTNQALAFVAKAHGYEPESLRTIFGRHHLSLSRWSRAAERNFQALLGAAETREKSE